MKKELNKCGFTLIELLAVIVILAVIALIATPMILGVIEKSKKSAFQDSIYGVLDSVEYYMLEHNLNEIPTEGIEISELSLKDNSIKYGKITGELNNPKVTGVSDGVYCAYGTRDQLTIHKGEFDATNPSAPSLGTTNYQDGKMVITINEAKDEESGISNYICYYGTTEETTEIGTTKGNNCELPMGEDYYGKVCAINGAGLETCSSSKQILKYLIKDGVYQVPFTETNLISIQKENNYLDIVSSNEGSSTGRSGIYTTNQVSLTPNSKVYSDIEMIRFQYEGSTGTNPSFIMTLWETSSLTGNNQEGEITRFYSLDSQTTSFNESFPRKIVETKYLRTETNNITVAYRENVNLAYLQYYLYNTWIQY